MKPLISTYFRFASFALVWAVAYLVVFHEMLFSGYRILPGDMFDTHFILRIHEHWFQVLSGNADWLDVRIFYPAKNTLGLSDAFVLFGMTHSLFRFFGLDLFQSFAANLTTICLLGFLGTFLFFRKGLGISWGVSLFASFLFIINQTIIGEALESHIQLFSLWYCPWFLWFGLESVRGISNNRVSCKWIVLSALSLALLFYNAFYFAWFMVFFLGIFGLVILLSWVSAKDHKNGFESFSNSKNRVFIFLKSVGLFGCSFLFFMIPFFITYLPVLSGYGSWEYEDIVSKLPSIADFFSFNLTLPFVGELNQSAEGLSEHGFSYSVVFILTFLLVGIYYWIHIHSSKTRLLLTALVLGTVLSWSLVLKVDDFSFWKWVFELVPGGSAIRDPFRFNAFLVLPIVTTIAVGIESWVLKMGPKVGRFGFVAMVGLLASLLVAGEWFQADQHKWRLDPIEIEEQLTDIEAPPIDAKCFFVLPSDPIDIRHQMLVEFYAMAVAQKFGVPTINGHSGKLPIGYNFRNLLRSCESTEYLRQMRNWLFEKGVTSGIYSLDVAKGKWAQIRDLYENFEAISPIENEYTIGSSIFFGSNVQNPHDFSSKDAIVFGFSGTEDQLTWTEGKRSGFLISFDPIPESSLKLRLHASALVSGKHPKQTFSINVNGVLIGEFECSLQDNPKWREFKVPSDLASKGAILVTILSHNPVRPCDIEDVNDSRELGLAVYEVVLQ